MDGNRNEVGGKNLRLPLFQTPSLQVLLLMAVVVVASGVVVAVVALACIDGDFVASLIN